MIQYGEFFIILFIKSVVTPIFMIIEIELTYIQIDTHQILYRK